MLNAESVFKLDHIKCIWRSNTERGRFPLGTFQYEARKRLKAWGKIVKKGNKGTWSFKFNLNPITDTNMSITFYRQFLRSQYLRIGNQREWLLRGCGEITKIQLSVLFWLPCVSQVNLAHNWPTYLESLYTTQIVMQMLYLNNFRQICSETYQSPVGCTPGNLWPAFLTVGSTAIYHPSRTLGGIL